MWVMQPHGSPLWPSHHVGGKPNKIKELDVEGKQVATGHASATGGV